MTQAFYARVLDPLTEVVFWTVPVLLFAAVCAEVARTVRSRPARDAVSAVEVQRRRDSRLLLAGAILGTAAAHIPVATFASVRLGMLLVLPAFGAAVGLAVSGLLPPVENSDVRVATLERRSVASYVSPIAVRLLWGTCAFTVLVAVFRQVLPPETTLSEKLVGDLDAPFLSPTRALYVLLGLAAVALTATAWAAASAVVRRGRPAPDPASFAIQDAARRETVERLASWTTATLMVLSAALLTPLPSKMEGVVFGDVQLVQRATDVVILALVIAAAVVAVRAHLRTRPVSPGVAP